MRELARQIIEVTEPHRELAERIGFLSMESAGLDVVIDKLFEPLLNCTRAEVASIVPENFDARSAMLKRLLTINEIDDAWQNWIVALLNRVATELAPNRNRVIHDAWQVENGRFRRTQRRAIVGKAQAREPKSLLVDPETEVPLESIDKLITCTGTVSEALKVAVAALRQWRSEGQLPPIDPQWLPASKPNVRCPMFQRPPEWPEKPLIPLRFETD